MICTKHTVKKDGLNIWSLPEAGNSSVVDIIAVQGLGSHPFYTWVRKVPRVGSSTSQKRKHWWRSSRKHREGGDGDDGDDEDEVMWLRDLLPSKFKNARIATYSFRSDWRDRDIKTTLRQCSEQFLNILLQSRNDDEERQRPLILIGHSLGGIVIQQALDIAVHGDYYSDIRHSVTGIIFLGAPFRGSEMAAYGIWIAKAAGLDASLLSILEKDNSYLYGVSRDFWASYEKLDIVCFYENKSAEYGPWKQRVVDLQSASIQGKRMMYLDTDHSGLNKFHGADDGNYLLLLPEIQRMVKGAPSAMASRQSTTIPTRRHWVVPFGRNRQFIGRGSILEQLLARIPPSVDKDNCQRTAIKGLGGVGKTQVALEAAFRVRDMYLDCFVFWVPAVDITTFENAYRKIGQELGIKGIDEEQADVKLLVREALDSESAGRWLLIIDNADDIELFSGNTSLSTYLPSSYKGSILFTTRDHKVAVELSATPITVGKLERGESRKLLETGLEGAQLRYPEDTSKLLDFLEDLPLAIKQASTYMAKEGISTTRYLELCQKSEADAMNVLSEEFGDLYRYNEIPNPVTKTFRISFEKISKRDPLAADYLRFISFLSDKDIPRSLLPLAGKFEATNAIGTLKGYAFITEHEEGDIYDIHRLVRLSMLNWLANTGGRQEWATKVTRQLENVLPVAYYGNKVIWMSYLAHVQNFIQFLADANDTTAEALLLCKLGRIFMLLARFKEAEDMLRKALDLGEKVQEEGIVNQLEIMSELARVLHYQKRDEAAEKILRETLALRQATHEADNSTLSDMIMLANTLTDQQRFEESESMQWQALELAKEILGKRNPGNSELDTHATSVESNTILMFREEARNLCQQAHETDKSLVGVAMYLMADFARRIRVQGRYEEAEQTLRQLILLVRTSRGDDNALAVDVRVQLGESLMWQGKSKAKEAVEILRQALVLGQKVRGEAHPRTLNAMYYLGIALYKNGDPIEAVKVLRQTLVMSQKVRGEANPDTLNIQEWLEFVLGEVNSDAEDKRTST